jgi:GntR family transcriptional regulator
VPACAGARRTDEDGENVALGTAEQADSAADPGARRRARLPKHAQVRSYLTGLIESELSPGDAIPSERTLATRFGVARMTVRHAVDRLVTEGVLRRDRPVGTFVTARAEQISLGSGTVTEAIEAQGRRHRYRVIGRYTVDASADVAGGLSLPTGARVHVVRRIRLAAEDPLAVESVHVPAALTPTAPPLGHHDVADVLRRRYGLVVDEVEQVVEVTTLSSGSARVLDVAEHSPALTVRRRSIAAGRPVAYAVATYRGDRCRLHVDAVRN